MKKILAVLVLLCMVFMPLTVFAEDMNGDLSPEEGYVSPYGNEQYKRDKLKYDPYTYIGYYIDLEVPMYMQKTDYFGGPACVEMIIDYLMGPSHNQEYYANYMKTDSNGTNIESIEKALNNHQDRYHYDKRSLDGYGDFMWRTVYSLNNGVPYIADINSNAAFDQGEWQYPTNGHYIVISGMKVDNEGKTTLSIRDPWKIGSTTAYSNTIYNMVNNHWDKALVH